MTFPCCFVGVRTVCTLHSRAPAGNKTQGLAGWLERPLLLDFGAALNLMFYSTENFAAQPSRVWWLKFELRFFYVLGVIEVFLANKC